jgi:hypothetical protein
VRCDDRNRRPRTGERGERANPGDQVAQRVAAGGGRRAPVVSNSMGQV